MSNQMFKMCIINGREQYAFARLSETSHTIETKSQAFPEGLLSFLNLDMAEIELLLSAMTGQLKSWADTGEKEYMKEFLRSMDALAQQHIYFELFNMEWASRIQQTQAANILRIQWRKCKVGDMPKELRDMQQQIKDLFTHVLDYDRGHESVMEKTAAYYRQMDGAAFPFRPQFLHFEFWDDHTLAEVLYPESICDLISYQLQECVRNKLRLRVCQNCGRYFHMSGRNTAMYCNRAIDEKGRTCKGIAPIRTWAERSKKDAAFCEYRREYKRRFAWIKAGKIQADDFYAWSKLAKEKKAECNAGTMPYEDFAEWLRTSQRVQNFSAFSIISLGLV